MLKNIQQRSHAIVYKVCFGPKEAKQPIGEHLVIKWGAWILIHGAILFSSWFSTNNQISSFNSPTYNVIGTCLPSGKTSVSLLHPPAFSRRCDCKGKGSEMPPRNCHFIPALLEKIGGTCHSSKSNLSVYLVLRKCQVGRDGQYLACPSLGYTYQRWLHTTSLPCLSSVCNEQGSQPPLYTFISNRRGIMKDTD